MKRKVLALIMSCMMLVSMAVSAATYSDVSETHDRYEAINMLSSLDIITGYPDGTFQPDKEVTRAEMAALITRMFKLTSAAVTEPPFSDVEVDYWAAANIVAAKNMNIINGFPDGTFRPQDNVTYEQAVKMIVCALNYGTAAEALGGYPGGYINQASKLNILNKAAYGNTKPAPRGIIAQLLFNSLKVDMLVPQVNADGTINYTKPENSNSVLEQFQKTKTLTNVTVVRTPRVNMEPGVPAISSVNDDAIFVKTAAGEYVKLFVGSNTNAFSFIGQQVDISYQEDSTVSDTKTLTSITKSGSVMIYQNIKLSNVVSLSSTELVYYTDKANGRKNTIRLNGTPTVIYNERLHSNGIAQINADLFSVSNHEYAYGVISLYIGTNTLIKAKSYKTYVVERTDNSNEVIEVKGGTAPISIPYKDTYVNETVIRKGNFDYNTGAVVANASKLTSYSGISKGNIIAVAVNAQDPVNGYYEVLVSSTVVSGSISEYTTDDETGRPIVKIGTSSSYVASKDLDRYSLTGYVLPEVNAKFHLDPFNQICYISDPKTADIRLGLLLSAISSGPGIDKTTKLTIYDVNSDKVETYEFRDEADVSDVKDPSTGNLITDYLFQYTLKGGKIDNIAPLQGAASGDDTYHSTTSAVSGPEIEIKKESTKITYNNGSSQSFTFSNKDTKVILIGAADADTTVTPKAFTMVNYTPYPGKVYRMNSDKFGYKQYVIIRPYEGLVIDSPTYIVESIGNTTWNSTIQANVVAVNVYSFTGTSKAGNSAGVNNITITESVLNALQLKKGDVFSYYNGSNTAGIDIEILKHVYIVARADEIANGTYPTAGFMDANDNANLATGCYNRDYRFWGIQSNHAVLVGPTSSNVYNYYFGIPLEYDLDNDDITRTLRMAKNNVTKLPILPGDTIDIGTIENSIGADNDGDGAEDDYSDYFYQYDISSLTTIYVYDAAESDSRKLLQVKDKDEINNYLDNLHTIQNNKGASIQQHDTVMVKAYHATNGNTLYNLYIIKDAR